MKKDIKRLGIMSIILFVISTIVILSFGKEYTVVFDLSKKYENKISLENENENIELIKKWSKKDKYYVKVRALKKGRATIYLDNGVFKSGKSLYIHNNLVITDDNFFGKSTCSEVIPISLSIILVYLIYILIKRYREYSKDNLYQYRNIAYLGIIIFLSFFAFSNITSIISYKGLFDTVSRVISIVCVVSVVLFPIAFIVFTLVTISNIRLIRKEGKSVRNILGLIMGIFVIVLTLLPDFIYKIIMQSQKIDIYNLNSIGPYAYNFFETLIYLGIAYLECILIATIIIAIKSVRKKIEYNKDYIIILGCQIRKDGTLTPLLKGRVDRAINFRNEQLKSTGKDLVFVASGGKGNDEVIAEGEAIANYLKEQGINKKNILVDDKSKNTYENIKFSNKLINDKKAKVIYSTTNYHVLRAGLIATEQGLKMEGIGSKTKAYFWINAFIREFIGTIYSERKKHIIVIIMIVFILIIMIYITYLANNIH